jgi:hypothetical protein
MRCGVSMETAASWGVMSQWKLLSHGVWCLFRNSCIMGCGVSIETAVSLWKLLHHGVWCLERSCFIMKCCVFLEAAASWGVVSHRNFCIIEWCLNFLFLILLSHVLFEKRIILLQEQRALEFLCWIMFCLYKV